MAKWIIGQPGGPAGPFYSVVSQTGEAIALQIVSEKRAKEIVRLGAIIDCDLKTIEKFRDYFIKALLRDGCKSGVVDEGAEDYVIRTVIETILHASL